MSLFGAHLCPSTIIYKAVITVVKSMVSEHSSLTSSVVAPLKWKNSCHIGYEAILIYSGAKLEAGSLPAHIN